MQLRKYILFGFIFTFTVWSNDPAMGQMTDSTAVPAVSPERDSAISQRITGKELVSRRTAKSKTYWNGDGTITTVISSGYEHYRGRDGQWREIDRTFQQTPHGFAVREGLYQAEIGTADRGPSALQFTTPTGASFTATPVALGYYDRQNHQFTSLTSFAPDSTVAHAHIVTHYGAFPGVNVRNKYLDTRIKEEIDFSATGRNALPHPSTVGISDDQAYVTVQYEVTFSDSLQPWIHGQVVASLGDAGMGGSQAGFSDPAVSTGAVEFRQARQEKRAYYLPVDYAWAGSPDSLGGGPINEDREPMLRIWETRRGQNYLVTGVPYTWVTAQPAGAVILDPTVAIEPPTDDVWIEYNKSSNYNNYAQLRIGRGDSYPWKRSLIKFNVTSIPGDAIILGSQMKLYYYGKYGSIHFRSIQAHQVLKNWIEAEATWYDRADHFEWKDPGVGLNDNDAKSTPEDTKVWGNEYPTWKKYDLTDVTQRWVNGTDPNYGVLLWATDEDDYTDKDEKWVRSSEYSTSEYRPKLVVTYVQKGTALASYEYNVDGQIKKVTYGNGMIRDLTYDGARGWAESSAYTKSSGLEIFRQNFNSYDDVGNLLSLQEWEEDHPYGIGNTYDDVSQITNHTVTDLPLQTVITDRSYAYDANGNLEQMGGATINIDPNSNRLEENSETHYDANGNLIEHEGNTVVYDWRNRMSSYDVPVANVNYSFSYDTYGTRVKSSAAGPSVNELTYYINSGPRPLIEYSDNWAAEIEHLYANGQRIGYISPGEDLYYVVADQVGSERMLVDESGEIRQLRTHLPYGKQTRNASGNISDYQFSGKRKDGTGLYYFGQRYYDLKTGRWLTADPAGQYHSPYVYVGNNPINMVDPTGELGILTWASAIYNGIQTARAYGNPMAFLMGFNQTIITGGVGEMAGLGVSNFTQSALVRSAVSSSSSSYIGNQMQGNSGFSTTVGPYSYDWSSGGGEWANPFDMKDTGWNNMMDVMGWTTLGSDLGDTYDYIVIKYFTNQEIVEQAEAAVDQYGVRRKADEPYKKEDIIKMRYQSPIRIKIQ